jgi:hypothetical protein
MTKEVTVEVDIIGWLIGLVGIAVGIFAVFDVRRRRKIAERLIQYQSETIHNLHGFILGLKASPTVDVTQVNDRLEFVKQRSEEFKRMSSHFG